ncbi:MAG: ATP-binding cassette domain-containing protein [Candidatus Muiribacteriota bacterium]
MNKIVLKNISKTYNKKKVLDIKETEIPLNGIVAIVGWSGAGKSTLINILSLMDTPDVDLDKESVIEYYLDDNNFSITYKKGKLSPEIIQRWKNKDPQIIDQNQFRRRALGFIFQEPFLHPNLSIDFNVKTPLFTKLKTIPSDSLTHACSVLDIEEQMMSFSDKVSGGQAQRASILRGLLKNAPVLFGDEITNNLDHSRAAVILEEISMALKDKENKIQGFFWVSHDIHLIKDYASLIVTIKQGELIVAKQNFESFDSILEYIREDNELNNDSEYSKNKAFNFDSEKAGLLELGIYYFSYAYNDLFKDRLKPTVDYLVVVLSLSFIILFIFSIFKISYASHKYLELKLSDPRINFLEIRASENLGELTGKELNDLKIMLKNKTNFITPVYYVTTQIKDLKRNIFRSNSNAVTFRKGDPIVNKFFSSEKPRFIYSDTNYKGYILNSKRAESFGYDGDEKNVILSFNGFNSDQKDKKITAAFVDSKMPFNKTMMLREEFYLDYYKMNFNEKKPPMAFIMVYPKNIYETSNISKIVDNDPKYEIIGAFKVDNKIAVIKEIKKHTSLFLWLSITAVTIISVFFVGITIYRNIHKKKREIGVFLAYGMSKFSFQMFYLCEAAIIMGSTFVLTMSIYFGILEKIINRIITKSGFLKVVGNIDTGTVIPAKDLSVPAIWLTGIYFASFLLLGFLFVYFIGRLTSQKPIQLIRSN